MKSSRFVSSENSNEDYGLLLLKVLPGFSGVTLHSKVCGWVTCPQFFDGKIIVKQKQIGRACFQRWEREEGGGVSKVESNYTSAHPKSNS